MLFAAITRAFTLLYTLSLLTLLTRIQLNLLGRRNYLSSVVSLASPPLNESTISLENHDDDNMGQTFGNDFDTNRNYLTFSWWLLNRGWRDVMSKVEAAVKEVFGPFNPRDDIPMSTLAELVLNVRKKVEGATEEERKCVPTSPSAGFSQSNVKRRQTSWLPYLLPPTDEEEGVLRGSGVLTNYIDSSTSTNALLEPNTPLRRLLDETSDLISSPHFTHVLTHTLNATFSLLIDTKVQNQAYKKQSSPLNPVDPSSTVTVIPADMHAGEPRTKLANILAVITRQAHSIGPAAQMDPNASTASANEYLHEVESVRDLEAFSAVVYSSNFEWEAPGLGEGSGGSSGVAGAGSPEKKATDQGASGPISVEDSAVDLGATSPFENAWGKATL
jgi:peroxin-3